MKAKMYLIWAIVTLVLASMACNFITGQPTSEGVLFEDDFSNTFSGWDKVSTSDRVTDYNDGVYRIWVNDTYTDIWANPGLNFTDTIIEVEATKVGGPDDNNFGVICRYQDNANFYFFYISSDGYYAIGHVLDGKQTMIGQESMMPDDTIKLGNATNQVRADCIGNELALHVNGREIVRVQDANFSSGDVGLLAGTFDAPGTDIHFDNFVVRKP
jgi:hypothetical protein